MKKKLLALLLSGCMIFSMVGCGSEETKTVTESTEVSVEASAESTESIVEESSSAAKSEEESSTEESIEESSAESVEKSTDSIDERAFRFPDIFEMKFDMGAAAEMDMPYDIGCITNQKTGEFVTKYKSTTNPALSVELGTSGEYIYLTIGDSKVYTKNTDELDSMNTELALNDEMLEDGTRYEEDGEVTEDGTTYVVYKMFNPENEGDTPDGILYVNKSTKIIEKFDITEEEASITAYIIPMNEFAFSTDGYTECTEEEFGQAFVMGMFSMAFGAMDGFDFDDEDAE